MVLLALMEEIVLHFPVALQGKPEGPESGDLCSFTCSDLLCLGSGVPRCWRPSGVKAVDYPRHTLTLTGLQPGSRPGIHYRNFIKPCKEAKTPNEFSVWFLAPEYNIMKL